MGQIFLVVPDAPVEQAVQLNANRTIGEAGIRLGILDRLAKEADLVVSAMAD